MKPRNNALSINVQRTQKDKAKRLYKNTPHGNVGGVGNTLEDLLGIEENNLPIPNAAEWELKCQRKGSSSLTTLFHMEPSPRAVRFVPSFLLPQYGWSHELAGTDYPETEMSFRQTIHGLKRSDRGFCVAVDRKARKVLISFDASSVDQRHRDWLISVKARIGLSELNPQPYWGFDDLFHKAGTKLLNCFYVQADVKRESGREYYHYDKIMILSKFSLEKFISSIEDGIILIDFDARTGHNHGTKFRIRQGNWDRLYDDVKTI
ncbi:MAG: MvaI/BcnI family restriction endonuclease [Candidatus Neomarinimicrobiota bacterium]